VSVILVDTLYDDAVERWASSRRDVAMVMDPRDDEVPFYTPEGYLVVRCEPGVDGQAVAEELQRQTRTMTRVIGVFDR